MTGNKEIRGIISISRLLLSGALALTLLLAPFTVSARADMAGPHAHSSLGPGAHSEMGGLIGHGHGLFHCASISCSPPYVPALPLTCAVAAPSCLVERLSGTERSLRSLRLDCDPPVPRTGFFRA